MKAFDYAVPEFSLTITPRDTAILRRRGEDQPELIVHSDDPARHLIDENMSTDEVTAIWLLQFYSNRQGQFGQMADRDQFNQAAKKLQSLTGEDLQDEYMGIWKERWGA